VASGKETSAKGARKRFQHHGLVAWSNWKKKGDTRVFDYVVLQPVTLAQKIWVKADMVKARLQGLQSLVGSSAASVT
jgi:hypothetical protein